jgi:hypothetical protein
VHRVLDLIGIAVTSDVVVTSDFEKQADAVSDGLVRLYLASDGARREG